MPEETPTDPQQLVDMLEGFLLEGPRKYTGPQVAEAVGIDYGTAQERWRSLGFSDVGEDVVAFTDADLEALRITEHFRELGLIDPDEESALIRTLGRSFARLTEWQYDLISQVVDRNDLDVDHLVALAADVMPATQRLQDYIWRRNWLNVASRQLLAPAEDTPSVVVGFADIVGYTHRSRSLTRTELADLVERFEHEALAIITAHGGRIIKTIGDEVMFVADDPVGGAAMALELVERHAQDEAFPELRAGLAYGQVLARLGDVFGPTVNIAARLTSVVRPGRVLVDRTMAEAVEGDERFRVRKVRRQSVKGYRRLEPYRVMWSDDPASAGPVANLAEKGRNFLRAVDEVQARFEGTSPAQGLEQGPGGEDPGPVVPADEHHG